MLQKTIARVCKPLTLILVLLVSIASIPSAPALAQASPIGTGTSTASSLVVRSKPSSTGSKLGTIARGTKVTIYAQQNGWYQIAYKSGYGWVSGKYINYKTSTTVPSPTPTPTSDTTGAIGSGVIKTGGSSLNVRSGPSTSNGKVGSLKNGTSVLVYKSQNGWYQIKYNTLTGWVLANYVTYTPIKTSPTPTSSPTTTKTPTPSSTITPSPTPTPSTPTGVIGSGKIVNVTSYVNVRKGPSTSNSSLGKAYINNVLPVYSTKSGWVEVLFNGQHGWINGSYIKVTLTPTDPEEPQNPNAPEDAIGTGVCNVSSSLNVRSGPGTTNAVVGSVPAKKTVYILAVSGAWYKIDYQGLVGWCSAVYINANLKDETPSSDSIVKSMAIYSYEQMNKDIAALKARYPEKITVSSIGHSVEGRTIPVLIIGNESAKNQILIHAGIHAREYLNPNLVMMQIEYMLTNSSTVFDGQTLAQWMSDTCFHIIPIVNPDGTTISQTKSGSDDILAICTLNLVASSNLSNYLMLWKANAHGVDLNLQFPSGWSQKQSASKPAGTDYKGTAPFTEPESKALRDYTKDHSFDVTISYHSTGSIIYVEFPLATDTVNAKSRSLGNAVQSLTGYSVCDTELTEGAGYKDWAVTELGIPSITIETGTTSCPLPLSQFSSIWSRNKNLWPVLVKWARSNSN